MVDSSANPFFGSGRIGWRIVRVVLASAVAAFSSQAVGDNPEEHLGLDSSFTPLANLEDEIARSQNYTHGVDKIKRSDGNPYNVAGVRIAIWDTGGILTTHESFGGRAVDAQGYLPSSHATLTAGIIGSAPIAGIDLGAEMIGVSEFVVSGYSYCPSATADVKVADEMRTAFLGTDEDGFPEFPVNVANHSWGFPHCYRNATQSEEVTRAFDDLSFSHPEIVAVVAAGNEGQNGNRLCRATPSLPDGYTPVFGTIRSPADAKNVITVGNLDTVSRRLPVIFVNDPDVIKTDPTSSNGPAAGGRIKPDVLALGRQIVGPHAQWGEPCEMRRAIETPSCAEVTENNHESCIGWQSGSSFSSPFTAGVIGVLQAVSHSKREISLRADEAKALLIHSTLSPGNRPSYTLGWGPYRADHAADLIGWWNANGFLPDGRGNVFTRLTLRPGEVREYRVRKRPGFPVRVTATWLDAPSESRASAGETDLVYDLDIALHPEIDSENGRFLPWTLDPRPGHENDPAVRGINNRDNVERIDISGDVALPDAYNLVFDAGKIAAHSLEVTVIATGLRSVD